MLLPNYHTNNSSWGHQCVLLTTNLTFNSGSVGEVPFHHFTEGDTVEQSGISRLFRKIKGGMFYLSLCIQAFIERVFKDMRRWTIPVFHWQIWSGVFWNLWQLEQSPQLRRKMPSERALLTMEHARPMAHSKDTSSPSQKAASRAILTAECGTTWT